jgi:hypothetical protein
MTREAAEKLSALLQARIPAPIDTEGLSGDDHELAVLLNRVFSFWQEIQDVIVPLSRGDLDGVELARTSNYLSSPFKELHSQLMHLTWQTKQVAAGDYSQRVDFMGEFADAFNHMIDSLDHKEKALNNKIAALEDALARIDRLEGILPICADCKKVRLEGADPDEPRSWVEIEGYISAKTEAKFSHGICPAATTDDPSLRPVA